MRRIVGIVMFVAGILLFVGGVAKLLPGGRVWVSTSILTTFIGAIVFALSFIRLPPPEPDAPPPLSPADRVMGVFYDPGRVFGNLRHHPRWLAGFLVLSLCMVIYTAAFTQRVTPKVIGAAPIDKLIDSGWIQGEQAAQIRARAIEDAEAPAARITTPLAGVGLTFIILLIEAALFLLFVMMFGGRMNYWQALSVATYAMLPPFVVQYLLSTLLLYLKPVEDINPISDQQGLVRADLSLLFSPTEHLYLFVLCGFIGLLSLYRLWLTATGLRQTGVRVSQGSAWTIALLMGGLYLLFLITMAALFPNFVS